MAVEILKVSRLRTDLGTQARASLNGDKVKEYAAALNAAGRDAPILRKEPVVAFFDGAKYVLADGFHWVEACRLVGVARLQVDVRDGDERAALLHSVGANAEHGLPRSPEDKRHAVHLLLRDPEWGARSSNWIAAQCKVSHTMVDKLRKKPDPAEEPEEPSDGMSATLQRCNVADGMSEADERREDQSGRMQPGRRLHRKAAANGEEAAFDWQRVRQKLGYFAQLPDRIAEAFPGAKKSPDYHAAGRMLDEFFKVMERWQEALTKKE